MALLGYARVSTSHQKLTVQITELKSVGVRDDRIFTDMMSGATDEREGLQRLLARAEKDDIIICTKMDRLGRNTVDMIHIVDACYKKGIAIRFLENGLSTEGTMGKMVIQILAAVAEAERERILERTNDGRIVGYGIRCQIWTETALESSTCQTTYQSEAIRKNNSRKDRGFSGYLFSVKKIGKQSEIIIKIILTALLQIVGGDKLIIPFC